MGTARSTSSRPLTSTTKWPGIRTRVTGTLVGTLRLPGANQRVISRAGIAPSALAAADLDGDGVTDLAVTSINDDTLAWLKGARSSDGTITFTRYVVSTTQLRAQAVAIADMNGDGRPDLVCAAPYGNKVTYFRNLTRSNSAEAPFFAAEQIVADTAFGASGLAVADLDHDGYPEVVSAGLLSREVAWHPNSGSNAAGDVTFGTSMVISSNLAAPVGVALADFDRNGSVDVGATSQDDGTVAAYLNRGVLAGDSTVPPTLLEPIRGTLTTAPVKIAFHLPEAALDGSVTLTFVSGAVVRVFTLESSEGTAGNHSFSFDPANPGASDSVAGSPAALPDATYELTLSYRDAAGNLPAFVMVRQIVIDTTPPFVAGSTEAVLAVRGAVVPGAGAPASGIAADAQFRSFGLPSINAQGVAAYTARYSSITGSKEVIVTAAADTAGAVLVREGDAIPNAAGVAMAGLQFDDLGEVMLNDSGAIAFLGKIRGAGVTANTATGLWTNAPAGPLRLVARAGDPAPDTSARIKAITAVALSSSYQRNPENTQRATVAFTASLQGAGVTTANQNALFIAEFSASGAADRRLLLRTGQSFLLDGKNSRRVKSFVALGAVNGAIGQGRGAVPAGVLARVKFQDNSQAVVRCSGDGMIESVATAQQAIPGEGVRIATFGLPVQNENGDSVFTAKLNSKTADDALVFAPHEGPLTLVAREGDSTGRNRFKSFRGAVVNEEGAVAFLAKISGAGINALKDEGIWFAASADSSPVLIAREGSRPPGTASGATWRSFRSLALADAANGPVFLADLTVPSPGKPNPAKVTPKNNTGIWAIDSAGDLRLIVREGDLFPGTTLSIRALGLLGKVSGSPAQTRSFNARGELIYRASLSDGSEAIVRARLP